MNKSENRLQKEVGIKGGNQWGIYKWKIGAFKL